MTTEMEVATKYQSHLPALLACVASTSKGVIEIGVGYFSTPHLHAICGVTDKFLMSVEPDDEWRSYFESRYESRNHWFKNRLPSYGDWSVAFIDHSPGGPNRADAFKEFIELAEFVVVHDYHCDNEEAIGPMLSGLTFHVCKSIFPPTLVASKNREIPCVLLGM